MGARLTGTHKFGEGGQKTLDADAAHVHELTRKESLPISSRDRRRQNHLRRRVIVQTEK